jgi:hypothetical protein
MGGVFQNRMRPAHHPTAAQSARGGRLKATEPVEFWQQSFTTLLPAERCAIDHGSNDVDAIPKASTLSAKAFR